MQAVVRHKYGSPDVLKIEEVPNPVPKDNQVLIRIYAVALNAIDWRMLSANPFLVRFAIGLSKPRIQILGADIAGVVEAVGEDVKQFTVGSEVYGDIAFFGFGGLAEFVCVPETAVAYKPTNLSFAEAASVPMAAVTALQGLRDTGKLQPGQKVLINGASGGVGTFTIQMAKYLGAEVTAVCSTTKMEFARSLGADHVIDYTKEDFTKNGQQYDIIFAANGFHPITDYKRALSPKGVYIMAGGKTAQMSQAIFLGPMLSKKNGKKMTHISAKANQKDLTYVKELIEAGKIKPVIDRIYPFNEAVNAFRYLYEGHAKGKIVISVK